MTDNTPAPSEVQKSCTYETCADCGDYEHVSASPNAKIAKLEAVVRSSDSAYNVARDTIAKKAAEIAKLKAERDALKDKICELEADLDCQHVIERSGCVMCAENERLKARARDRDVVCAHCTKPIGYCNAHPCPRRYDLYLADLKAYIGEK